MLKIKPQNPKGVRDYLPLENQRREYIISVIKKHYELYGFQSIYNPVFERLETLQGKYGDEGDKLLFKILNSGDYLDEKGLEIIENKPIQFGKLTQEISSKGLRYDHTVPLARFVSQHQNELTFPFKRYVIGPVWRADRPQKGRYQEFFQCDADIVGSKGLVGDVEMITLIDSVFKELNLKVEIKINNRKIYNGICEEVGIAENHITSVSTILDKWDKIGEEKVKEELSQLIGNEATDKLVYVLAAQSPVELNSKLIASNSKLTEGLSELNYIFTHSKSENLKFDLKLLRGLDYYTGTVLEMVSTEMVYGSIGGGGRYDDLTELFGLKDMSGIGISFGLDRVYDVMTELRRFPENSEAKRTLILNLTEAATSHYFSLLSEIRGEGKIVDLYPNRAKMDKQLAYADKAGYSYAIIIGENELKENRIQIKNLKERSQVLVEKEIILSII
ncbi:MAG: histidine--tRNA ligase [Chitinophagales bacterium]|jgi:histidyl-tRNA synthetase|nr:histidine--tRNA ligase [Sphingobacteriales bacterium]